MDSYRVCSLALICAAFIFNTFCRGVELDSRSLQHFPQQEYNSNEKELIHALQGVLEKLKNNRFPLYGKKHGQLPMCEAGDQCALRKGARIGKLCDCPYRISCNSFLLRCL
ncbi:hypothetical protein COCON_G00154690 [Conger conger]|uniref:Cocaine- and amphetamine-regulated transcript protein n=1 Tax=Conger conger TaxID=82655 RepID=A0A9Q1D8U8_CONCO|nr:cocaine- and amphetamine-regulated transcript protein-like [Conger conger]KAJ8263012.1 hypothetical protein COCON_G00154690 [Conger conger]